MAKKQTQQLLPFESTMPNSRYIRMAESMMNSAAWRELNLRQRGLYLYMKAKYKPKASHGVMISSNADDISVVTKEMKRLYGDLRTFREDIDKLIACGFVRLVASGRFNRSPNIYGFSSRWQQYGQEGYAVPPGDLRIQPKVPKEIPQ